jgi:hypothetical protein
MSLSALFRMINDTEEKDEEFIQETYTCGSFLLSKHIQEKIGKKLKHCNVYRNIPKKKRTLKEEIEGKDIEKDLNEAKYKADIQENILMGLRASIAHMQEIIKGKFYDEIEGDYRYVEKEGKRNSRIRTGKQLMSTILAQIYNLSEYLEPGTTPRNEAEAYELIQSYNLEETLNNWTEQIRNSTKQINIEIASKLKYIRQVMYSTDAKKTIQLLTKDQTHQCNIEHEQLKNFFDDRWKTGEPINRNLADTIYKIKETTKAR